MLMTDMVGVLGGGGESVEREEMAGSRRRLFCSVSQICHPPLDQHGAVEANIINPSDNILGINLVMLPYRLD